MIRYLHLDGEQAIPAAQSHQPFKAIIIAESDVTPDLRSAMCEWLSSAGCLYLMAWGQNALEWQEGINLANLQNHDFGSIPDGRLIITTTHEHEDLAKVFWFAKYTAMHPCAQLDEVMLVHIADEARATEFAELYEQT